MAPNGAVIPAELLLLLWAHAAGRDDVWAWSAVCRYWREGMQHPWAMRRLADAWEVAARPVTWAALLQRAAGVRVWGRGEVRSIHDAYVAQAAKLDLSSTWLTALPRELGQLGALRQLYLGGNHLTALPREIGQLGALQQLDLGGNQLTAVPRELGLLGALQLLDLADNQLTALPRELGQLSNLKIVR